MTVGSVHAEYGGAPPVAWNCKAYVMPTFAGDSVDVLAICGGDRGGDPHGLCEEALFLGLGDAIAKSAELFRVSMQPPFRRLAAVVLLSVPAGAPNETLGLPYPTKS